MKPWAQVVESSEYRRLSFEEREQARQQYFADVVAPKVPAEDLEAARGQFDADTAQTTGPQERSLPQQLGRAVGRTVRAGVQGITALPALVADIPRNLYGGYLQAKKVAGGAPLSTFAEPVAVPGYPFPSQVRRVRELLTEAGLPEAETPTERVAEDIASALAAGGGTQALGNLMSKSAGPVVSRIGDLLSKQRGLQAASAITGAGAAGTTREAGGGVIAQIAAGLAGAAVPAVVTAVPQMAARGALRGGEQGRQRVAQNIRDFEESGYGTPTAGQASEGRIPRAIESTLSKTPGGAGAMARRAEAGAEGLGARVTELADDLTPRASATKAGAAIEKGVAGFVDRFKGEQRFLYEKLDAHIPKQKPVDMTNTVNRLSELNADIPGAPELSRFFKNSTIQQIEGAMKADTQGFTTRLPYEALKKLRTLVGAELENKSLTSNVPRSKWQALYAALSDDLAEAANEAGPEAMKAYRRANTYTRAGHERIGTYLDRVAGKDTVERVFQAAVNPAEIREGASTINAVLRSIKPDERKIVQAAFLKRLGVAAPGAQDELGEVFSAERFLTNWNKISPEAKLTMFADQKGALRENLDRIAKVAANLREGSRVFANPSGTQQAISSQMAGGGALIAILTGHPGVAIGLGATALSANGVARLMTNPEVVRFLARTTTAPAGAIPAELNTLAQISQKMNADDREAVSEFIETARRAYTARGQQR